MRIRFMPKRGCGLKRPQFFGNFSPPYYLYDAVKIVLVNVVADDRFGRGPVRPDFFPPEVERLSGTNDGADAAKKPFDCIEPPIGLFSAVYAFR
jgi:hypothetical protein